jgi:hypothetical protein
MNRTYTPCAIPSGGWRIRLALLCLLAMAAGCGRAKGIVSGKVSYNGKPVVFGMVQAFGSDGLPVSALIQPDGRYTLPPLPVGETRIAVSSSDPTLGSKRRPNRKGNLRSSEADRTTEPEPPQIPAGEWFPIPGKYQDYQRSGLSVTVSDKEVVYDIALTD